MGHEGTFATKAEIDLKVGERVDDTGYTEAAINAACKQSEGFICLFLKYDFVTNWATIDAVTKAILSEFSACWVAMDFIAYNMENYGSRIQAENLINVHQRKINNILKLLSERASPDFIKS
jgi:hypothetical protein